MAARSDARFCSTRCRVAAHRARHRPPPDDPDLTRLLARLADEPWPVSL
jgi:hypothetical protein